MYIKAEKWVRDTADSLRNGGGGDEKKYNEIGKSGH